jgi:hypothetical protein
LDLLVIAITTLVIGVTVIPRLPSGICFGDSGDLQLASATLGIAHPPGYAGYVTLGYLVTRLPWLDPADVISWSCLLTGLVVILMGMKIVIRLGGNSIILAAALVVWLSDPLVWANYVMPEVYLPSLALVMGSILMTMRFLERGRPWSLGVSVFLFGFAVANRPNLLLMLPGFLVAWWLAGRLGRYEAVDPENNAEDERQPRVRVPLRTTVLLQVIVLGLIAPYLFVAGYVIVRDGPSSAYSYVEEYNRVHESLPEITRGLHPRIERAKWLLSGAEYESLASADWVQVRNKLRWLSSRVNRNRIVRAASKAHVETAYVILRILGASLVIYGFVIVFRRCGVTGWMLASVTAGSLTYTCWYGSFGDAADILPLSFVMAMTASLGLSRIVRAETGRARLGMATGLAVAAALFLVIDVHKNRSGEHPVDAAAFLEDLDMAGLPQDAVVLCKWGEAPPLWYAQRFLAIRSDVDVIRSAPAYWPRIVDQHRHRAIFSVDHYPDQPGWLIEPYRNIYRWRMPPPGASE